MSLTIQIDGKSVQWSHAEVVRKLTAISNLSSKKIAWIKKDLDLSPSWWVTRLIWSAIGKRFECLRKNLYGVDLDQSRNILKQIAVYIKNDASVKAIYSKALVNFNLIAPNHAFASSELNSANVIAVAQTTRASAENRTKNFIESLNWSAADKKYVGIPYDEAKFLALLDENNEKFKHIHNYETDHGIIAKRDLPKNTQIFVRADLHGDLKSLVENLRTHQKQGMLDENYRCKPGTQLVFLGDYSDRGEYSIQVLQLLMYLRLENPDNVTLIRGNHESLSINAGYCANDPNFKNFLFPSSEDQQKTNLLKLDRFYDTLHLTMYMAEETTDGSPRQYIQFTHGLFELKTDPAPLLSSPAAYAAMIVPKIGVLSERIKKLVTYSAKELELRQKLAAGRNYNLEEQLSEAYKAEINRLEAEKKAARRGSPAYKHLKMVIAAKVIDYLLFKELPRDPNITVYNWGDMSKNGSGLYNPGFRNWALSVIDVKHFLRLTSVEHKVKVVVRGHQHAKEHYTIDDQVVVSTMPIGMNCSYYAHNYQGQLDTAYILTTGPKIKDWKKRAYFRPTDLETKEVTADVALRDPKV